MTAIDDEPRDSGEQPFAHTALLYEAPERLRVAVGEFAAAAASAEEPLLTLLPDHSEALLGDVLEDSGARVTHLGTAGELRNPNRMIPVVLAWLDAHPGRARVLSEAAWPGRGEAELTECLRHEALVNVALADRPARLLCPFDAAHLGAEVLAGARMTHPWVIDGDHARPSESFGDPLDLARGERWPQPDPSPPLSERDFDGDLWALRHELAGEELLADLNPVRREDLVFAVNEAAGNAVRHGDGHCRVRLWRDRDRVVAEILTASEIEDPLAGRRPPTAQATSGRGLWLINQLCDLVEIRSGPDGASVRMHVDAAAA